MRFFKRIIFMAMFFSTQFVMSEVVHKAGEQVAKKKPPTFLSFLFQPKFIIMILIGLVVLFLLKNNKLKSGIKVTLLLISTFLFGFAGNIPADFFHSFAMHPSPMCAATSLIRIRNSIYCHAVCYIPAYSDRPETFLWLCMSCRCYTRAYSNVIGQIEA